MGLDSGLLTENSKEGFQSLYIDIYRAQTILDQGLLETEFPYINIGFILITLLICYFHYLINLIFFFPLISIFF